LVGEIDASSKCTTEVGQTHIETFLGNGIIGIGSRAVESPLFVVKSIVLALYVFLAETIPLVQILVLYSLDSERKRISQMFAQSEGIINR